VLSFCTLGISLAFHVWQAPPPYTRLNQQSYSTNDGKNTFMFTLITHYTCKRYLQWVKICEIPCLVMLQMLKVCMTSRATHGGETQKITLDSGSPGAENSWWLREY